MKLLIRIAGTMAVLALWALPMQGETSSQPHLEKGEIFKRAFWKRPSTGDKILNASYREWTDAAGDIRWQWFIVVMPSKALLHDLREENAFSLVPDPEAILPHNSPEWFSFDPLDFDVVKTPGGNRQLFFGRTKSILYATDSGGGFKAGAPEPVRPAPYVAPSGRIPPYPPPNPELEN